jgi:hypothetical protein
MTFLTAGIILSSDLVSKEIVSSTVSKIYNSITGISEYNLEHINELLEEFDLYKKIEIVESIFENNILDITKKTFNIALNNLHEISEKISLELEILKNDIEHSKTLYLKNFKYIKILENLKRHSKILDNRLDLFLKL